MNGAKTLLQSHPWIKDTGDGITVAGSALTTDKSAATVHALTSTTYKRISLQGPYGFTPSLEFRFRMSGAAENATDTLNLYAMADPHGKGDDHYTLVGTITITAGTQVDANAYPFADGVSIADELWIDDVVVLNDASDGIARIAINTQGYSDFVFLLTGQISSTAVFVDYRRV
jgi:hypothetical protein